MNKDKIFEIIAEQCDVDVADVTLEKTMQDDLGLDSLDIFQIIMAFEEEFGIEIPTEDVNEIKTVGDIVTYLEGRLDK